MGAFTQEQMATFQMGDYYSLKGQTAVVTGGATGLGLAITRCLISAGAKVVVLSRGAQEDAQEVNDREALCNRFDKKIHDLELTRMVSLQMAPQIRMVQSSDVEMSEKIQSTLVNTIPLWKSQMIIALGVEHSRAAAEAQRKVSDLTNDLLKKNAEKLKVATVETAKESERGIVDMETLVATNESLMSTIDEVMHIQQEGRQKRREAESKLMQLEDELKNKMLNPRG